METDAWPSRGGPHILRSLASSVASQAPATSDALACTWLWSLSFTCEERPCRRIALLCAEQGKVSVTTSESLKSLILQNYSQKIISVRWFIIQLGFIAWFIEGSAIWHICSLPDRRDDGSLGSFLPSLNQWWLPKLIYHGPGWFTTEFFMLETGKRKSMNLLCTFYYMGITGINLQKMHKQLIEEPHIEP